jgi:hypothetical protein
LIKPSQNEGGACGREPIGVLSRFREFPIAFRYFGPGIPFRTGLGLRGLIICFRIRMITTEPGRWTDPAA